MEMEPFSLIIVATVCLALGSLVGYFTRQSIARRKIGSIEETLQRKISQAKQESEEILAKAKRRASSIIERAQREESQKKAELLKIQDLLLEREKVLNEKSSELENKEKELTEKIEKVKKIKETLEKLKEEAVKKLERISGLKKSQAKKELFASLEAEYQKEILEKIKKLEKEKEERFQTRAKEILATVIQKLAVSQAQELTTTTVTLPNED
ncbi:MAG TPA: DUF3552 domain-containing protein, partial [bacterium]|nr:DUF3552 domain-containing protein [bacterium]